jgi:hypothetical protein
MGLKAVFLEACGYRRLCRSWPFNTLILLFFLKTLAAGWCPGFTSKKRDR